MSDTVSEIRKELGEKAGRAGETLHKDASPEFVEAYNRGSKGFGSNVAPKYFGKGSSEELKYWNCVCGERNSSRRVRRRGGEIVCWMCGVPQSYGEDNEQA